MTKIQNIERNYDSGTLFFPMESLYFNNSQVVNSYPTVEDKSITEFKIDSGTLYENYYQTVLDNKKININRKYYKQ